MAEPPGQPARLGELLGSVGRRLGLGNAVETGLLWRRWRDIVGPALADHVEPTSLRDRVLRVRADSPAWATEVGYLREEIRRRANASMGMELIAEVRVWTGPGSVASPSEKRPASSTRQGLRAAPRDPIEALERARSAWARRMSSRR
ncbi:hypothetical protein BH24ACT26_BH24ACT26_00240 [soil metagenome]